MSDLLDMPTSFSQECLRVAEELERAAKSNGSTMLQHHADAMVKAAMLLKEVVRGV